MTSLTLTQNGPRAVIFGCQGLTLTVEERAFFSRIQPLGFILFARNCESPAQIRKLIEQLRACVDHEIVPILIDQEGGRVARLRPPHWRDYAPAGLFGRIAENDMDEAIWAVKVNAYLLAQELAETGITVNCAPVVDLALPNMHPIIGDRSFGDDPDVVATLCEAVVEGFQAANIISVVKHLPGHGRAHVDSHEELPVVNNLRSTLAETDFEAFQNLCQRLQEKSISPWGMTAHITYTDIDPVLPATQSPDVIRSIIRQHIGFKGFLISDCLTMKALSGSYSARVEKSLKAGCDAVLHCNGELEEMMDMMAFIPPLSTESLERLNDSFRKIHTPDSLFTTPTSTLEKQLNQVLKPYLDPASRRSSLV
jgi:beta-N-acetylhexosaminidase